MRKILFTICLLSALSLSAQNTKGWFLDAHVGTRLGGKVSDTSTLKLGIHADGGVGYMINNVFGIKFDAGFDSYKAINNSTDVVDRSYSIRGTTQGIVCLSELFKFGIDEFGLNFHAGYGFTTHINPSVREQEENNAVLWKDNTTKGNDDYVNIIFGLNPQYHLNKQLSISLDMSALILPLQDHYVDKAFNRKATNKAGMIYNVGVGIQYRIPSPNGARFR